MVAAVARVSYRARANMINVHLYFLKLFGCMLERGKAVGRDFGIDIRPFSDAIMTAKPHPDVLLRFGVCDGVVGRSDMFSKKGPFGGVYASWLYQLGNVAVGVTFAPPTVWQATEPYWHPNSPHYSRRLQIADFRYAEKYAFHQARERIVSSLVFRSSQKVVRRCRDMGIAKNIYLPVRKRDDAFMISSASATHRSNLRLP